MTLTTRTPMLRCGKRFGTEDEALHSKLALAGGHGVVPCAYGCGGWHLERQAKAARDTGPSRSVRSMVLDRDGYACAGCGKNIMTLGDWWSMQHRVARGVGGGNSPSGLVVLCGSATSAGCHRLCEDRDADAHRRGLWLRSDEDPASVPVCYRDGHGGEFWALLEADGGLVFVDAPGGAAA
jgi:hypothetical protein